MAIIGSLKERFQQRAIGNERLAKREDREEDRYTREAIQRTHESAREQERLERAGRQRARESKLRSLKENIADRKYAREKLRKQTMEMRHPTYTKIKEGTKETLQRTGKAGKQIGKQVAGDVYSFGKQQVKESFETGKRGYQYTGESVRKASAKKYKEDPRGKRQPVTTPQSEMRPVIQPTTYSLGDRVAMESYRPSMFQSDITRPGEIRQPTFEQRPPQDLLAGIGTGLSMQRNYFGNGAKLTLGSTKKTTSKGLALIGTTKKKNVRYY